MWTLWAAMLVISGLLYANKAAAERSAFVRWRHQASGLWQGKDIYDTFVYPNPPIVPILLRPLMILPPVPGAVLWFACKGVMATIAAVWCFRMATGPGERRLPWWAVGLVLALSARPLLSDLNHGNINILILFLIVATLEAWRRGYDVGAGILLGLAITCKVTPGLFLPYFVYKRSWRTVAGTFLGLALFFVVVPSVVLGPNFNAQLLSSWWHRMLSPYVMGDDISPQEVNQSLGGVMTRLLVQHKEGRSGHEGYHAVQFAVNVVSLSGDTVGRALKVLSFGLLALLGLFCRTKAVRRDDPRLLGEYALVVLTMLFASERTWKHHYVTLMLPYAFLVIGGLVRPGRSPRARWAVAGALSLSAILISTTSNVVGHLFAERNGHELAMAYGMFFWGAVVLYAATAALVYADLSEVTDPGTSSAPILRPHLLAWMNRKRGRVGTGLTNLVK
jgi:hypothetical protein